MDMAEDSVHHSRPRGNAQDDGPRKRRRVDNTQGNGEHDHSQSTAHNAKDVMHTGDGRRSGRGASYRPKHGHPHNRSDNYRPRRQLPLSQERLPPGRKLQSNRPPRGAREQSSTSQDLNNRRKHSRKQRKENPSTRIHSLRKQLAGATDLPPTIARERQRELAALIFEQERNKLKSNSRKNLERYHFIRFIEKQKAVRNLKKLRKLKEDGDIIWKSSAEIPNGEQKTREIPIDDKIHEFEIDLLYTQYSPLGQKYIAIYAETDAKTGDEVSKAERYKGNWNLLKNREDLAVLSEEQRVELQRAGEEAAGLITLNSAMRRYKDENNKPPIWFEIESAMNDQSKLEAIRGRQAAGPGDHNQLVMGLDRETKMGAEASSQPDWLDDDGAINPDDLDSDSDDDAHMTGGVKLDKDDSDDEMSDGAGGFFEGIN